MRNAFQTYYDEVPEMPTIRKYRSWIGSDRDGNPNVTSEITWSTLLEQRRTVLELYLRELDDLRQYISVSRNLVTVHLILEKSLKREERELPLSERHRRRYRNEPFRRKITYMMFRLEKLIDDMGRDPASLLLEAEFYKSSDFINDLELIRESLVQCDLGDVAEYGKVKDLLIFWFSATWVTWPNMER